MARYLGTIQGSRGEASRLGHRSLVANVNSWHAGLKVEVEPALCDGKDTYTVTLTGGSGCCGRRVEILKVEELPGGGFKVTMPADASGKANVVRTIEK